MGEPRPTASGRPWPLPDDLRAEIEGLREMPDFYRVWGDVDGAGVVIRSEDPVEFQPDCRIVNVVPVRRLEDAIRHVNIATQTVGIYPEARKRALRDAIAYAGTQRVVSLGAAVNVEHGLPHDGFRPLQRFVRWVNDEVCGATATLVDA
jgi:acyl-CoA reductase LuxC